METIKMHISKEDYNNIRFGTSNQVICHCQLTIGLPIFVDSDLEASLQFLDGPLSGEVLKDIEINIAISGD